MNKIYQYRPAYFSGFEQEIASFNTLKELLSIPFVKNFSDATVIDEVDFLVLNSKRSGKYVVKLVSIVLRADSVVQSIRMSSTYRKYLYTPFERDIFLSNSNKNISAKTALSPSPLGMPTDELQKLEKKSLSSFFV